jgi:hypothetical protein
MRHGYSDLTCEVGEACGQIVDDPEQQAKESIEPLRSRLFWIIFGKHL